MSKGFRVEIEVSQASAGVGRRHLLGAGVGGAALSLLPFLSSRANASSEDGTTTTAPPKQPTDADATVLAGVQQVELTLVALYDTAIKEVTTWDDAQLVVLTAVREAHQEFASALNGILGRSATNASADALFAELSGGFKGDRGEVLLAMHEVESAAVATQQEAIGALQGTNGAALLASVQIAEARHCTILADLAGSDDLALLLVNDEAASLSVNG